MFSQNPPGGKGILCFGVFELDLESGELRKAGRLIKVSPQPLRVLALLATRNDVVTRDEIQKQVWSDATYVDFERGINHCISQIRAVLDDNTGTPRYVQTLPRRGYRFVAPVVPRDRDQLPSAQASSSQKSKTAPRFAFVAVCLTVALASTGFAWKRIAAEHNLQRPRVPLAVLPFNNLSGDPQQDYFAEGMTEALITQLGKFSRLRVISKQSVMHFNGNDSPPSEIARQLNVDEIVKGFVLQSNGKVRITAQLIDPALGTYVWTGSYEGDLRDVLRIQREVASAIAAKIRVSMTPQEQQRVRGNEEVDPAAHLAYLRGRFYWNKRTRPALDRSIEYFQTAVKEDPNYAPAYAGLADSYNLLAYSGALPPQVAYPEATAAAMKALQLDDTSADAHTSLADIRSVYEWKWSEAEAEYRRAIELNSSYAIAHQWYASYLVAMGRPEESVSEAKEALRLDPLSLAINSNVGWTYYLARRYQDAIASWRATLDMDSDFGLAHLDLGRAYQQQNMYEPATTEMLKAIALCGETPSALAALGYSYAAAGKPAQTIEIVNRLKAMAETSYVPAYDIAVLYAGLGSKDEAFRWLQVAYRERSGELLYIKVDPRLDNLRGDPRFVTLLRDMGL
ncbi:MAG: winged helix-turn-helix domain-containing protein [Terriglobales bacterium]